MRSGRRAGVTLVLVAGVSLALGSCTTVTAGRAGAGAPPPSTGASTGVPSSPGASGQVNLPKPGQCMSDPNLTPLDCARPHNVEITQAGEFGGSAPQQPPSQEQVFALAMPTCRTAAGKHLGNEQYDATRVSAWVSWPNARDWAAGQRWYLCAVAEFGSDDKPVQRSGVLKGALAGDGLYRYQVCSSVAPSKSELKQTPCDGPHVAEGVGAVRVGEPTDPVPSTEKFNAAGQQRCPELFTKYLGGPSRPDAAASWRWPDPTAWRNGFTNVTCYAETSRAVGKPVRGLGDRPLPS